MSKWLWLFFFFHCHALYLLHLSFVCTSCLIVLYVRINTEYIYLWVIRLFLCQSIPKVTHQICIITWYDSFLTRDGTFWPVCSHCFNFANTSSKLRRINSVNEVKKFWVWFNSLRPSDAYMRNWLDIIGSDNGLSPGRRQAIIWTNAGILLIGPLGTNISEIVIEIQIFSFRKMHLKMSSPKWRPFCRGLNVLNIMTIISTPLNVWRVLKNSTSCWGFLIPPYI